VHRRRCRQHPQARACPRATNCRPTCARRCRRST
jgi:hypothetical protein